MAQGKGLPKARASTYGYGVKPAAASNGTKKPAGYRNTTASQIIETQRPEHQTIKVGKTSK